MKRRKSFRGHRRHRQPCYCIRCESGKFDDYLDKREKPTDFERIEMKEGLHTVCIKASLA